MSDFSVLYAFENEPESIIARAGLLLSRQTIELRRLDDSNIDSVSIKLSRHTPILATADDKPLHTGGYAIAEASLLKSDPDQLLVYDRAFMKDTYDRIYNTYNSYNEGGNKEDLIPLFEDIEAMLIQQRYILDTNLSFLDILAFPYIRALTSKHAVWFDGLILPRLHQWLTDVGYSKTFQSVTRHVMPWKKDSTPVIIAPWGI